MPIISRRLAPSLALVLLLAAAGCDTAEERAENHYQRGMELLGDGEVDRAMIEFRNVFRLNGDHTQARMEYAQILEERGQTREAFGQYLRLVEQDPDSFEGRRRLGRLALATKNFEVAQTHINAAYGMDPSDPEVRSLKATVDYAVGDDRPAALAMAVEVLAEDPSQIPAHMIVIANDVNSERYEAAMPRIETALAQAPEDEGLHLIKLSTLEKLGDTAGVGEQLRHMTTLFPQNDSIRQALIRWHLVEGDTDGAEAILRQIAAETPDDPEAQLTVVQFLNSISGAEAARVELERLVAENSNSLPFQRALAMLDFSEGETDAGISGLRSLIDETEPSEERRDSQVVLAQMLAQTGDIAGSNALADAVLVEDASHVGALKLRAHRYINADKPELAIQDLRTALEGDPNDSVVLTLMAAAHEREGSRELAGERLALAVQASERAPEESLRYARFLVQDDRLGPAESVVVDALRLNPQNPELLMQLGQIHLQRQDWPRVMQVAGILRQQDDPGSQQMANSLEATALRAQNRQEETIALLSGMVADDNENISAIAGLVQAYVEAGELDSAKAYLADRLEEDPKNSPLRMIEAGLDAIGGDVEGAESKYRAIIEDDPANAGAYRSLFGLLIQSGREDEAVLILDQGIEETSSQALLFDKAGMLERQEEFDAAIAIYEDLYARSSDSAVIANNLASLITTHRTDEASLEQAFAIARRLRGSDVPYYQDTYGWILFRRGDYEQALTYLEPAARALEDNALVQFHLGKTQAALENWQAAREAFERAVEIAGPDSNLPQIAEAQTQVAQLAERINADDGETAAPAEE